MTADLTELTAKELQRGYREKRFSVLEVTKAYLGRIERENPVLNAYVQVFGDAEDHAKGMDIEFDKTGGEGQPLLGVPIAVKDNILIRGKVCSSASKMLANYVATYDATAIAKLKSTGALFLGRANMDEFAMGSSTEHSVFGPTKNPHDTDRVPGGSSGGSAAAVAAKLAPIALGSDTCGSIRHPASLCGVVGLKPTYGAVSRSGLIAMGSSLDQIGPLSRTVSDSELIFDVIKGRDPLDGTTLPDEGEMSVSGKRIGVPREFVKGAAPNVVSLFEMRLDDLAKKGYDIVDIDLPSAPYCLAAYYIVMPAEVSTNLARLDGMRYGHHASTGSLRDDYEQSRAEGFGAETRRRIILGTYVLSHGYYDAYYRRATALRSLINSELKKAFESVSFISTPTTPNAAFKIGEKADPLSMYLEDIFAAPANLTGIPAISVPAGLVERDGKQLPVGIQFMSPKRTEKSLFGVARDVLNEAVQ